MSDQQAEDMVLETLSKMGALLARELFNQLQPDFPHQSTRMIREAIWRLIDKKMVRLTTDRKLENVSSIGVATSASE